MAVFGFGKDKKDSGNAPEQVLAYLEEAQRARAAFTLARPGKAGGGAAIQSIDESQGLVTFQLQQPLDVEKGGRVELIFIQENMRIGGTSRVAELRPGIAVLDLPGSLEMKERRAQPRARLNPKEGTTLTALTGIFDGVGITGIVENLSEAGAKVRVEKAMSLKGEKRLPLGTALVPPGQEFMLIKLNKAPKCAAVMELSGRAVVLDNGPGGLTLGLAFDPLKPDQASALRGLVASRTTPVPASLPAKARRKAEPAPAPQAPPPAPRAAAPAPAPVQPPDQPPAAAPAPAPVQPPVPGEAPQAPELQAAQAPKQDALLRLKKRSRAVVALVPNPAFGDVLKDHLQEEGFGRVLVTHAREELAGLLQQPNLAVLLLDGDFSTLDALQFIAQLKTAQPELPPVILAVEDVSTSVVLAARRNGVTQMLVKPYILDAAFTELLNQQM